MRLLTNCSTRMIQMKLFKKIIFFAGLGLFGISVQAQSSATISRKVQFIYDQDTFKNELVFNASDYYYYKRLGKKQFTPNYGDYATESTEHPYLIKLAKELDKNAKKAGYEGQELAEYLVAFVQQAIPYKDDPENDGYDYPRYPIETIIDRAGDCEDKSALLVALLNTFGFEAILISPPGHMAAGIWCEDCVEGTYELNGKKYAYIETSVKGWPIGVVPSKFAQYDSVDVYRPE